MFHEVNESNSLEVGTNSKTSNFYEKTLMKHDIRISLLIEKEKYSKYLTKYY